VSASSRVSWPRAELALALALFGLAWGLLHVGFLGERQIVDTPVYEEYGDAILGGSAPYRDFAVEYPPAALPVFVLPALFGAAYRGVFEALMWLCGAAALVGVAASLAALRAPPAGPLALAALAPLALGSVVLTRYDLWPAALTALALAALLHGRLRLGHAVLGLAVAAKAYAVVLAPLALVWAWRRHGPREAARCAAAFAGVVAAWVVPFLVLSPGGVWDSIVRQTTRPLQLESLGAAVLHAAHQLAGVDVRVPSSHGSQNVEAAGSGALGTATSAVQIAVVAGLWLAFARGPATGTRLVRYAAATVAAFIAFGKVLSPQYLIWLVPLVPLVPGVAASALLVAGLVLTQLWFPHRYWELALELAALPSWLVVARDLVLVALVAVLVLPGPHRPRTVRV
jgi:hypothetical protein